MTIIAALCFSIGVVGQAVLIWLATKIVRLDGTFREAIIIAIICSLLLLIPKIGLLLAAITFFVLLIKWLQADPVDAVLMSLVTCLLQLLLVWATL